MPARTHALPAHQVDDVRAGRESEFPDRWPGIVEGAAQATPQAFDGQSFHHKNPGGVLIDDTGLNPACLTLMLERGPTIGVDAGAPQGVGACDGEHDR
jgi:hypothetical protein